MMEGKEVDKFILCCFFLSGNWIYLFLQDSPNYEKAIERTFFMGIAMLFVTWWPYFD